MTVHQPVRVRRLVVSFEGRCKVRLKAPGMPKTDGIERRTLNSQSLFFLDNDTHTTLEPGQYTYPISFELPSNLPASFRGKRGYIRYRLQATLCRPLFVTDLHTSHDITLRRCLMGDLISMAHMHETVDGTRHKDKLQYSATAPTITYREGGLIQLNLAMQLVRPSTCVVRSVTCALRERIQYRTTGQQALTCQSAAKTDDLYPLGWSTFSPAEEPDYNPAARHEYNAVFRLCPRVNADTNTRLLRVSHSFILNIMVEERESNADSDAEDMPGLMADAGAVSDTEMPSNSRPGTPTLSRSSSSSSISSLLSLRRSNAHEDTVRDATTKLSSINPHTSSRRHHRQRPANLILCSLEIPLVVTSRERFWDGDRPEPPAYQTAEEPPSYGQTIEQVPPVPCYT
ncbi:Arrestin domain-containing protein 2 [Apophysomyces sp. BC1015]|nr:Arrestin domain-containing protein 2 [Apophysomyces sp. BC1015]